MESEIRSWLKPILKENIDDFCVNILGNSEKGDGYLGDIVFVSLTPTNNKCYNKYDLVLKCSKRSQTLREKAPVKEAFLNEILIYDEVLPAFTKFQSEKQIKKCFQSVPKYYGKFTTDTMEIVVLENLKKNGYSLWDRKRPLTREHLNIVLEEYAKFHSISIAMKQQKPEELMKLTEKLNDLIQQFTELTNMKNLFEGVITEIYELLKGDLDDSILEVWKSFTEKVDFILRDMVDDSALKVILHGDCWCNNFMFKHDSENSDLPLDVALIDWQISRYSSPILDLSYFIFAGISQQDLKDLDTILDSYYKKMEFNLKEFGLNLNSLYSKRQFLEDWAKYCKYGIMFSGVVFKVCVTEKEEATDIVQVTESGNDFGDAFNYDVKNKDALKNRARYIVKYAVEHELI